MEHRQTKYTKQQLELVERINRGKDYYEILNVSKDATDDDIRRKYKMLGVLIHPDKNNAPGAKEAFVAINKAYETLIHPVKRQRYDWYCFKKQRIPDVRTRQEYASTSTDNFNVQTRQEYASNSNSKTSSDNLEDIMLGLGILGGLGGLAAWYLLKPNKQDEKQDN